ncbi:dentin sialophosphoprotein-like isoform X1 [Hippoglossus hippoglossus]|uniref:dentin sialophosphoprotein-like isoform X1 n=1 Tax=Hippoglossus hippoglossus TaxID=8267 RepID=UPI00148E5981|nr:dentin sialophosphoprotein-like isoform X1 [Hippoglossus hippoglossus]
MFKNMTDDGHLSSGQSSSSPAGHGVTSVGLVSQESSWIGLLSVVSRPALSFVQRYLPGRTPAPGPAPDRAPGPRWSGAASQSRFTDEERDFFKQLEHVMPLTQHAAAHLTDMRCQQDGAAGPLEPGRGSAPPWLTAASLRDLGIEDTEELNLSPHTRVGYLSSFRTFLSHVLMNPVSAQEVKPRGGADWLRGSKGGTWWGSLWGGEDISQRALSWTEDQMETNQLCPQQPGTNPPPAETTRAFVQSGSEESTLGENTGATEHKEKQPDNGGLHTVQNPEGSTPDLSISNTLSSPGGGACSESPLLTPDQDNGYSSLEEEHFLLKNLSEETLPTENCVTAMQDELSEETSENTDEDKQQHSADEGQSADNMAPSAPECQNKAIAFIMGCPCSDDDDSSLSESSDDDDDDDGFDSEGSSDLSDSTDSDSDSEVDSESERLWNSLCQSVDPYNPRSFSAQLHSTQPRTIPTATPPSSPTASPPLPSSSPLSGLDVWDDSTSASEADEVESIRLLSSFSCTSDPYSPFNFQAPIRTKGPNKVAPEARAKRAPQTPPHSPHHKTASPPEYRKDEAEECLDSGFSEPTAPAPTTSSSSSTSQSAASTKKVRFCDQVEEFFLGCEEDRRSPWEQLARDRWRFLRRCEEVEQSISFCLQPQHRRLVYRRLVVLQVQDTLTLHIQNEDILERISN